jgi:hypothetical protein
MSYGSLMLASVGMAIPTGTLNGPYLIVILSDFLMELLLLLSLSLESTCWNRSERPMAAICKVNFMSGGANSFYQRWIC